MERITQGMLASTTLHNIQKNTSRMVDINAQLSSGKRMNFASDDPASSVDSMRLRNNLRSAQQYKRNIDDANGWMATADSSMQRSLDCLNKAKEIMITANSGSQGPQSLKALAEALRGEASNLNKEANATYMGRTVFAGNSDKGTVFTVKDGKYVQSELSEVTSGSVDRQINFNQKVQVNVDGNALFGTQGAKFKDDGTIIGVKADGSEGDQPNVMNVLLAMADTLEDDKLTPEQRFARINGAQESIQNFHNGIVEELASLGARHDMVITSQQTIIGDIQNIQSNISSVEDIDIHQATIDMSLAEMAYKASLGATQRVIQPSLLDYLR